MKTRRPRSEERCLHRYKDGRQCANWRYQEHLTCRRHIPDLPYSPNPNPELAANNKHNYKNGLRAAPLKPLHTQEDFLDHLSIRHDEIYLAAEAAAQDGDLTDLARLAPQLTLNTLRFIKTLKK